MTPDSLCLEPHPEGGFFRETWRAPSSVSTEYGERSAATAILYLLEPGQSSAWHRVRSTELWLWQGGGSLELSLGGFGPCPVLARSVELGPAGQHLVLPGEWQAARPLGEAVVCGCVVVPGFDFADFELEEPHEP